MAQLFKSAEIVLSSGTKEPAMQHLTNKMVALYFSAGWCPPCQRFTPVLKKFYESLKEAKKPFEVVFVSWDRSAEELAKYYEEKHGAWLRLPFDSPLIELFKDKYNVKTIPSLRVIKPDGKVVVEDARTQVENKGGDAGALYDEWKKIYDQQ